jgi:hypothetical protein
MIIETMGRRRTPVTYTKALFHFDSASFLTDERGGYWSQTGTITTDTSIYKFGTSSAKFMGGGEAYLALENQKFVWGTGPFTIDFWYYPYVGNTATPFSQGDWSTNGMLLINQPYTSVIALRVDGIAAAINTTYYIHSLTHIAIVGNGGNNGNRNIKLFCDGTLKATYTYDYNFSSGLLKVGGEAGSTGAYQILDEYRISSVARWTSDFTPPTSAYTLD